MIRVDFIQSVQIGSDLLLKMHGFRIFLRDLYHVIRVDWFSTAMIGERIGNYFGGRRGCGNLNFENTFFYTTETVVDFRVTKLNYRIFFGILIETFYLVQSSLNA